jgi:hypothetical protein
MNVVEKRIFSGAICVDRYEMAEERAIARAGFFRVFCRYLYEVDSRTVSPQEPQ